MKQKKSVKYKRTAPIPGNEFPGCYVPSLQDFFIA